MSLAKGDIVVSRCGLYRYRVDRDMETGISRIWSYNQHEYIGLHGTRHWVSHYEACKALHRWLAGWR